MATRTRRKSISSDDDDVTRYAESVTRKEIVAGPYVRAACARHLEDLRSGAERGLRWDVAEAKRVIGFFRDVLTVEIEEADGESKVAAFVLQPWQCFVVGSLFGWKNAAGFRRFRRAYVEIAKGNGKSPLAAGIGHYMLLATGKLRAEVYSAATDKDQAAILFRDAVAMYERSPALNGRLHPSGQNPVWQLTDIAKSSFFKPISSEKKGKSGVRPYCALIDEVHEHSDNSVIEMLRAGTKGNQQALIFEITNSGFDKNSVCWKEHDYTAKVLDGALHNDAWFGFIASLDKGDDPFEHASCWLKANPNLGVSIRLPYLQEQVNEARGMPSKEALVRRLHFCEWTEAADTWLTAATWKAIEREELTDKAKLAAYADRPCYAALDLSWTRDLTALAYVFPGEADKLEAFVEFWTPKDTILDRGKRDGVDYALWVRQGHIFAPPGKVIALESVASRLGWAAENLDLKWVAYDKYRHKELDQDLADLGIVVPMIEHPQGFRRGGVLDDVLGDDGKPVDNPLWMPQSFDDLEIAIIEQRIRIAMNPALRWNVASAVIRDDPAGTGNRVFDKRKSTGRIDGAVALAMAVGLARAAKQLGPQGPVESVYEALARERAAQGSAFAAA